MPVDFALCGIRAPLATGSRSPDVLCQREVLVQSFVFSSEEPATRSSGRENASKPSIDRQNDPSGCGLRAADCGLRAEGCGAISFRERKRVTSGSAPREGDREGRCHGKDEALWREGNERAFGVDRENETGHGRPHPGRCVVTRGLPRASSP